MAEALLNEPQTPTDGKAAAQPGGTPAKDAVVATPAPDASASASASKGAVAAPVEKQQQDASKSADPAKKESASPKSLLAEPDKAADDKEAGEKKAEEKGDVAKPPTSGPPEKYDWKNDGDLKVSAPVLTAYEKAAREAGMTQDAAQKMLDSLRTEVHKNSQTQRESLIRGWADELSADPKIGGDRLEETGANMRKVLSELGSPELRELLVSTGLEFHPAVARFFDSVQRKVGGDRIVTGNPPKGNASDTAKLFFDAMPKG